MQLDQVIPYGWRENFLPCLCHLWCAPRLILGPILFSLYINDLPLVSDHVKWNLYEDDTAITYSSSNHNDMSTSMHNVMIKVSEWFEYNRLSLNLKKTQMMIFGTRPKCDKFSNVELSLAGGTIKQSDCVKYLGLMLDSQLSYANHVEYIRSKTVGKIKLLGRIAPTIKSHTAI